MENDLGVGEVFEAKVWACHAANGSRRVRVVTVGNPARNLGTALCSLPVRHDLGLPFVGFASGSFRLFGLEIPSFEVSSIYALSVSVLMLSS